MAFAMATASPSSRNRKSGATGPNVSSLASAMSMWASVSSVA